MLARRQAKRDFTHNDVKDRGDLGLIILRWCLAFGKVEIVDSGPGVVMGKGEFEVGSVARHRLSLRPLMARMSWL